MKEASRTAMLAAWGRASLVKEHEPFRGQDDVAIRLLPPHLRFVVNTEPLRRFLRVIMTRRLPGTYGFLAARSRSMDSFVSTEIANGVQQVVVLGAGYDSRAQRLASSVPVYEVDAPATSAKKQEVVARVFGQKPANVTYVGVDFDRQSLAEGLAAAGFDLTKRTAFTWEGVTCYLTEEAVRTVLRYVASAGPDSAVAFDYVFRGVVDGSMGTPEAIRTAAYVRSRNEPFTFGLGYAEVSSFIASCGLALSDHSGPEDLSKLVGDPTDEIHRVASFYGFVVARRVNKG